MVRGRTHRWLLGFGGEESAGASFLRIDGSVWTTDKDGIILGLFAAEITAKTGRDPGEHTPISRESLARPYTSASMPRRPRGKKRYWQNSRPLR